MVSFGILNILFHKRGCNSLNLKIIDSKAEEIRELNFTKQTFNKEPIVHFLAMLFFDVVYKTNYFQNVCQGK